MRNNYDDVTIAIDAIRPDLERKRLAVEVVLTMGLRIGH